MNQEEKLTQYLKETSQADDSIWDLAREYSLACELYDRTIFTGPILEGGRIQMWATNDEWRMSNRYAAQKRADHRIKLALQGIPWTTYRRGVNLYEESNQYLIDLEYMLGYNPATRSESSLVGHGER